MPANDSKTKDLKLIHLLWTIMVAICVGGVAWGMMKGQVGNNVKDIDNLQNNKVEKEVLEMHTTAQTQQFEALNQSIDKGFKNMDEKLELIRKQK